MSLGVINLGKPSKLPGPHGTDHFNVLLVHLLSGAPSERTREGLTTLYAVLLAGREAELRETTLVRNGISPEQAKEVAYGTPFVLPEAARRETIASAGVKAHATLQQARKALASANRDIAEVLSGLRELEDLEPGKLAELVHTLNAAALTCEAGEAPSLFLQLVDCFDDAYEGGTHVSPELSLLTSLILDCRSGQRVFTYGEYLAPTVSRLAQTEGLGSIHFQTPRHMAAREAGLLGLLQGGVNLRVVPGEPLMAPLLSDAKSLQKFDRLLLEPPFGKRLSEKEVAHLNKDPLHRFRHGAGLHRNTRELALAQHALDALDLGGVATLFAPVGVLFRGGLEGEMRRSLIEADVVEAIIALPAGAAVGTNIETALLKLTRHKPAAKRGQVMVVVVPAAARGATPLSHEVIEQVRTVVEDWGTRVPFARVVSIKEMREQQFVLQPARFVDDFEPPPTVNWPESLERLRYLDENAANHASIVDELLEFVPR